MTVYVMHPEVIQKLQEEIQHHPRLMYNLLQLPKDAGIDMKIGEIAAFCGIVLDGYYDEAQILELCDKFVFELRKAKVELLEDVLRKLPTTGRSN